MPAWSRGPTERLPGCFDSLLDTSSLGSLLKAVTALWRSLDSSDKVDGPPCESPRSILLALPSELRLTIYSSIIDSNDSLALLRTCQQIHMEASPTLYQHPVSFSSQQKLFAWIEGSQQGDLARVRILTLQLTDIDLSPLLNPTTNSRSDTSHSAWSLYNGELERLDGALRCLPGLERLTIVPPSKTKSSLLSGIYRSFLGQIPIRCPKLKHLTLHDHNSLLKAVPGLSNLQQVDFEEPTSSPSPSQSPKSLLSRMMAEKGKTRDVIVGMDLDTDGG